MASTITTSLPGNAFSRRVALDARFVAGISRYHQQRECGRRPLLGSAGVAASPRAARTVFMEACTNTTATASEKRTTGSTRRRRSRPGKPNRPPQLIRNTFGATIGGPILKDRFFFFAAYEGQRTHETQQTVRVVPSDRVPAGHHSVPVHERWFRPDVRAQHPKRQQPVYDHWLDPPIRNCWCNSLPINSLIWIRIARPHVR